jgi:putative membrane protein insertion efficiency factor
MRSTFRDAILLPVRAYQRLISPALPRRCKYHPTCSAYAVQAIESYGILRGAVLAAWRLLRCNPLSHGGYDPVSRQTLIRSMPRTTDSTHT